MHPTHHPIVYPIKGKGLSNMRNRIAIVLFVMFLSGCSPYAYSGYNPVNDPLGVTTRTEIREVEATNRVRYQSDAQVRIAEYDYKARSDEAFYGYQAQSETARYAFEARQVEEHQKTWRVAILMTTAPTLLLILLGGIGFIGCLVWVGRILLAQTSPGTRDMIPPIAQWRGAWRGEGNEDDYC